MISELLNLIKSGIELPLSNRGKYITQVFNIELLKSVAAEKEWVENGEIVEIFLDFVVVHLAELPVNRRQAIVEALSFSKLSQSQFLKVFNSLPPSKIVDSKIVVDAYKLYGVEFVESLFDVAAARQLKIYQLYFATEELNMEDRIEILIKARENGIHIIPDLYQTSLSLEQLKSPNLGIETVESISDDIKRKISDGISPTFVLDEILKNSYKSQIKRGVLVDCLLDLTDKSGYDLTEMLNILFRLDIEVHGKWRWLKKVVLFSSQEAVNENDWNEIIGVFGPGGVEDPQSLLNQLNQISPEALMFLYELNGLQGRRHVNSWLVEQLAIAVSFLGDGLKEKEVEILEKLYEDYLSLASNEPEFLHVKTISAFVDQFARLGCPLKIDEIGNQIVSTKDGNTFVYNQVSRFQIERMNAVSNSGDLSGALKFFMDAPDLGDLDPFFFFKLASLARDNGKSEISKQVFLRFFKDCKQFDVRTLTVLIRSLRIDDKEFLGSIYPTLIKIGQRFDSRVFHALCEKMRVAGAVSELETLFNEEIENAEFLNVSTLKEVFYSFLDAQQPMKSLTVLKYLLNKDGDFFTDANKVRVQNYGEPLVNDAILEWATEFKKVSPRRVVKKQVIQNYGMERNSELPRLVKNLYGSTCQLCGVALETPTGLIAQGAHIQPLGGGHEGPDLLENILCLCPNHHALLDRNGWYLSDELMAIETISGKEIGILNRNADHVLSTACIRYQRRFALSNLKDLI